MQVRALFRLPGRRSWVIIADMSNYTVPGLTEENAKTLITELQARLGDYNDLHLILKHAHWNVVGPNFIAVHEMIDPQVELVRAYADTVAERIATLGGEPDGTPRGLSTDRSPLAYDVQKGSTKEHLEALDKTYVEVIENVRGSLKTSGEIDAVTEDIFIGQAAELEKFQWFVRAHLDNA